MGQLALVQSPHISGRRRLNRNNEAAQQIPASRSPPAIAAAASAYNLDRAVLPDIIDWQINARIYNELI